MMRALFMIAMLFLSSLAAAQASSGPDALEQRARDLGRALRCVVCQNQSIEDSEAALAKDMRLLVRERLADGDSNAEILSFMRERYGDYVLLKPPLQRNTYLLWSLPVLLLLFMGAWLWRLSRSKPAAQALTPLSHDQLSDEDKNLLKKIMDETS